MTPHNFSPASFAVGDRLYFEGFDLVHGIEGRWIDTTLVGQIPDYGTEVFSVIASISHSTDSPLDEDTIAPDKTPLLPGESATFAN